VRGSGQDEQVIAWVVPNSSEATKKRLDRYLVSIDGAFGTKTCGFPSTQLREWMHLVASKLIMICLP
jgi:hypothetical protein